MQLVPLPQTEVLLFAVVAFDVHYFHVLVCLKKYFELLITLIKDLMNNPFLSWNKLNIYEFMFDLDWLIRINFIFIKI